MAKHCSAQRHTAPIPTAAREELCFSIALVSYLQAIDREQSNFPQGRKQLAAIEHGELPRRIGMRITVAIVCGLTLVLSLSNAHAQTYQAPLSTAPIGSRVAAPRAMNFNTNWNGARYQDQQTQPSPGDKPANQVPQVQMPLIPAPEQSVVQPAQDVPAPPIVNGQQAIGPALSVQSNAATMPDECYERQSWCQLGEPFKLFGQTPGGLAMGGWWESGYHSDNDGLWNTHDDRLRLHQAWLYAERKAPRCNGIGLGFRFDAIYGVDAQNMQAFGNPPANGAVGWDNEWDHGIYGWSVPQAYIEVARCDNAIIAGHYISPMGFENVMSPKNFFYSRSFARVNILPQTLTGTLSRIKLNNDTTVLGGVTTNWDTGFNRFNDSLNYIGGFAYKPCGPIQLTSIASVGDFGRREDGWTQDTYLDVMLTDKLNYIGSWTFENSDTAHQFSVANYLIYRVNDCLGLGSRFEWFKSTIYTGSSDSTYSWTSGINFRRNANIVVRPELRVDWGEGAVDPGQPIFASDMIITF
jgi:hypothetical protein